MPQAFTAARGATSENIGAASEAGSTTNSTTKHSQRGPARADDARIQKHDAAQRPGQRLGQRPARNASDEEILGITPEGMAGRSTLSDAEFDAAFDGNAGDAGAAADGDSTNADSTSEGVNDDVATEAPGAEPEKLRAVFDANPELRRAWQDAQAYRETFATPEEARAATTQLADLGRMDALFFSRRPEDHAELARMVADIDPAAFASLTQAMTQMAGRTKGHEGDAAVVKTDAVTPNVNQDVARDRNSRIEDRAGQSSNATQAQEEFFRATNAEAVQSVVDAIETQVARLLPENISKNSRNRVVGEIYRELDAALRTNPQFGRQVREAFRSGALDAGHQRAIVSLIAGRARQTLPGVAKRVLNEWTSTVVAANQDRRVRQNAAEKRIDIAGLSGAGGEGRRLMGPRDVDYARMSDADILNL